MPTIAPASRCTLFLPSTPLHTFWSVGLMHGPLAGGRWMVGVIDRRPGDRDFLADALEQERPAGLLDLRRFEPLPGRRRAGPAVAAMRAWVQAGDPALIVCGHDARVEFHAALSAARGARGAYVDDGLFSYVPPESASAGWFARGATRLAELRRSRAYGFPVERPALAGGSRAVREAWVLLPDRVHPGLAGKAVHPFERAWFDAPGMQALCAGAMRLAGFDAAAARDITLLLLLPHESFLAAQPQIGRRIEALAAEQAGRGGRVAVKCHPRTVGMPLQLPARGCIEVPRTLPVEVLARSLGPARVIGTLTSALLSLKWLGRDLDVQWLARPAAPAGSPAQVYDERTSRIYAALGIRPFA